MTDFSKDFDTTMRGLERGLRVEEIATFELSLCGPDDPVADLKRTYIAQGIDYLPVSMDGQIVGVFNVMDQSRGSTVKSNISPLAEGMMVSSSDPILDVLKILREKRYQLVVRRGRISGIVTRSDLLKLPVRILAFSQVAHLEMLLSQAIQQRYPVDDGWKTLLSQGRLDHTLKKQANLQKDRLDPPLLEFTDFCDKRDIVRHMYKLTKKFTKELAEIEKLRNQVAHAANYSSDNDSARSFISRLLLTEEWIKQIRQLTLSQLPSVAEMNSED